MQQLAISGLLLSREQLVPEIGALMMAGFDTSSHTIAWWVLCLVCTLLGVPPVLADFP